MSDQQPVVGLIAGIIGSGLIYAAIKNKNVVYVFRYALTGKNPGDAPATGKNPSTPKPDPVTQGNKVPGSAKPDGTGGTFNDTTPLQGGTFPSGVQSSYGGSDPGVTLA